MEDPQPQLAASHEMQVVKRCGERQDVAFDKILTRVKKLGAEAGLESINYSGLVVKIIDQLYDGIPTSVIDNLTAEQCATMTIQHPDYGTLAGYVSVSNHQRNTSASLVAVTNALFDVYSFAGNRVPLVSPEYHAYVLANAAALEGMLDYSSDFLIDYFGFKTLERSYLMCVDGKPIERVQHMWARVAIFLHMGSGVSTEVELARIRETYDLLSTKRFIHATPTLFNSGTCRPQLSSCYLVAVEDDSIEGIYNTLKDCALISKWSGGIGLHVSNVRANNSRIYGTNGLSNGLVPMMRVFNSTARYCNQGGKRNGSFAVYLEPWHADVFAFLDLKRNQGDEEAKARDLFYALWMPDLFMQRVVDGGMWSLFCPNSAPGLSDVYGDAFEALYARYEREGRAVRVVEARDLWSRIPDAQMETGTPYLLYKDAVNRKNNQANLGTIKSSNLCTEITLYSDANETAVCNLASISLSTLVRHRRDGPAVAQTPWFDFSDLRRITAVVTRNLNRVIDKNFYPTDKTRRSNRLHRPIGIGVQGLADCIIMMGFSFESHEAAQLNTRIFETIYYAALATSCDLAAEREDDMRALSAMHAAGRFAYTSRDPHCDEYVVVKREREDSDGSTAQMEELLARHRPVQAEIGIGKAGAYSSYEGSPMSRGVLQFDMWSDHKHPMNSTVTEANWASLRAAIAKHGVRNSMLVAPMPTASTSQILGNNECFEPFSSNIYSRRTMAGEFIVMNRHMAREMIEADIWSDDIKNNIIANKGSVQHLQNLPPGFKDRYKTVWEIKMRRVIDMARDRAPYIDQSQSMNLWLEDPTPNTMSAMHMHAWRQGLKTGIYYMRRKPRYHPQQFTIEPKAPAAPAAPAACRRRRASDEGECAACSA